MNYTPNIRKSSQTFVSVLQKAKDWFVSHSKTEQHLDKIFTDLIATNGYFTIDYISCRNFFICCSMLKSQKFH